MNGVDPADTLNSGMYGKCSLRTVRGGDIGAKIDTKDTRSGLSADEITPKVRTRIRISYST